MLNCGESQADALPDGKPDAVLVEIRRQNLEGLVAKRALSRYEPGERSGAWMKFKCGFAQEWPDAAFMIWLACWAAVAQLCVRRNSLQPAQSRLFLGPELDSIGTHAGTSGEGDTAWEQCGQ